MKHYKQGQLLAVGRDVSNFVVCEVLSVHPDHHKLWVINGCWNLTLYPGQGIVHSPTGDSTHPMRVLYSGPFNCGTHYQEQYDFARRVISSPAEQLRERVKSIFTYKPGRLENACKAAIAAFKKSWNQRPGRFDDEDDMIPF